MKILVITVCYNESLILPYFLKHYSSFCDKILIFDNCSTDDSAKIIKKYKKAELISYDSDNIFSNAHLVDIKNEKWKPYKREYDWIISLDMDEFIYHPKIRRLLKKYKKENITISKNVGFNMVADSFPNYKSNGKKSILQLSQYGYFEGNFSKCAVFDPSKVDICFHQGCHSCSPTGEVVYSPDDNFGFGLIKLLHYRYFGIQHFLDRSYMFYSRRPIPEVQEELEKLKDPEYAEQYYRREDRGRGPGKKGLIKVIGENSSDFSKTTEYINFCRGFTR